MEGAEQPCSRTLFPRVREPGVGFYHHTDCASHPEKIKKSCDQQDKDQGGRL